MVSLKEYSNEELAKKSLIELAKLIMLEEKKEMKFSETFAKVAALKGLNEEEKSAKISQFYTDLNVDGSFATNGSNTWGLKRWYKKEQNEEEVAPLPKRVKRRKKRIVKDEDLDLEFAMINNDIDDMIVEYDEDEDLEIDIDEDIDGIFGEDEEEDDE